MRTGAKISLIILICILIIDLIIHISTPPALEGFFTNDDENRFPADKIEQEYRKVCKKPLYFDDSLYIVPGTNDRYTTTSASKVIAYAAAGELDFVVTTLPLIRHYERGFAMKDLTNLTPPALHHLLLTEKDATGETKPLALKLETRRYPPLETDFYLFVPESSQHKDETKKFILWLFGI